MTGEKVHNDPILGPVTLRKGRVRSITIRVSARKGIIVTLPWLVPYSTGIAFLESRRDWVAASLEKQRQKLEGAARQGRILQVSDPATAAALRTQARSILPGRVAEFAARYGFAPAKVFLKANRTNWGSCSARSNLNLNIALAAVPEALRDYVILHELSHLRYHNHGPQFHALLERLCQDALGTPARELEKQLRQWILA